MRQLGTAAWVATLCACASTQRPAVDEGRRQHAVAQLAESEPTPRPEALPTLPIHPVTLASLEGEPTVLVPSVAPPRLLRDAKKGTAYFKAAVDFGVEAECTVRAERLDMGEALRHAVATLRKRAFVEQSNVRPVRRLVAGGVPVMVLTVAFWDLRESTPARHTVAAANVGERAVVCLLEETGSELGFLRLTSGVVESLAHAADKDAAVHTYAWVQRSDGWSGISERVHRVRADGVHLDISFASMVRADGGGISGSDDVSVEVSDDKGLLMWRVMRIQDGSMRRDVTLSPTDRGHLVMRRRGEETPVDLGLVTPSTGRSMRQHLLESMAAPPGNARTFLRYFPGLDEQSLAEETVELVGTQGDSARFVSTIRTPTLEVRAEYSVDADGQVTQSTVTLPQGTVTLESVEQEPAARRMPSSGPSALWVPHARGHR